MSIKLQKRKDIVIHTKKSYYMINPNALIPLDYEQAVEGWLKVCTIYILYILNMSYELVKKCLRALIA